MFTGIVEELGEVAEFVRAGDIARLTVHAKVVTDDLRYGDSVAVNGVCLTAVDIDGETFGVDVIGETLRRTTVGELAAGERVNLERAVTPQTRLGGHIVQGHVDGVADVRSREPGDQWDLVRFGLPGQLAAYVAEKGSICVDGVSLTVVEAGDEDFSVGLIPATLAATTLGMRQPGDRVNVEVDVVAKYVERLLVKGKR